MTDAPSAARAAYDADLQALRDQTALLVTAVAGLDDDALRAPSRCVGWTRAHVVSHVTRNARAMLNLVRTVEGTPTPMYPSQAERDADIERGSHQGHSALLAELRESAQELDAALAALPDGALDVRTGAGRTDLTGAGLPWHRLREVAWHHVDLDLGYTFADAPADLVARWWDETVAGLRERADVPAMTLRTDERDVVSFGDGRPTVSGSRAGLLLWLLRGDPAQVQAPAPDQLPDTTPSEDTP